PGVPGVRGALSYAIARALEGAAQRDSLGRVSRRGLFEHGRQVVKQFSESRQDIYTEPTRSAALLGMPVFRLEGIDPPRSIAQDAIRLRTLYGSADALSGIVPLRVPFAVVGPGEPAALVFDVRKGGVVSR